MKQDVLGLQFDNVTMDEAVARAEELLEAPGASIVVTPNAAMRRCTTRSSARC